MAAVATVPKNGRVVFAGDSRTFLNWMGISGEATRLKALIEAIWATPDNATYGSAATQTGSSSTATLVSGALPSVAAPTYPTVTFLNSGVSGSRIADLDASFTGSISAKTPDLVIIWHNTNDANGIVGAPTDPTVFQATYQSVIDKCKAYRSTIPIVVVSDLCYGEYYLTNPSRINSLSPIAANVPSAWSLNPQCAAVAAANPDNCVYADICTPYLAWLMANYALPGPGTGGVTTDGLHENTSPGMGLISTWVLSYLDIPA